MQQFKVGDWVRNTSINRVWQYTESDLKYDKQNPYHNKNDEPWQPKEGEWCWFFEEGNPCCPMLKRFDRMDINGYPTPIGMVRGFKYCEPFIGELPSFLKDK